MDGIASVELKVISADTHIIEPPDIYKDRMASSFGDSIPVMKRQKAANGKYFDAWFIGDMQVSMLGAVTQAGQRFEDASKLDFLTTWEDVREGAYKPDAMLRELAVDGIWGAAVQPSQGLFWYHIEDSKVLSALCQSYNDWLVEFCKPHPGRLRGVAMLNVDDVLEACRELEWCAQKGLAGAFIPVAPLPGRPYRDPIYERLWWTANDVGIPLIMHLATQRANVPGCEISASFSTFTAAGIRPTQDYWVRYAMTDMIFAGIFERYPNLRIGSVEHELSWAPHWLRQMDYTYTDRPVYASFRSKDGLMPSDFWRRNMFGIFQEDEEAVLLRHKIGLNTMLWGNDFPHSEATWPHSQRFLTRMLDGVPEAERHQILWENPIKLFGFKP